jgi:hypothetical protein
MFLACGVPIFTVPSVIVDRTFCKCKKKEKNYLNLPNNGTVETMKNDK